MANKDGQAHVSRDDEGRAGDAKRRQHSAPPGRTDTGGAVFVESSPGRGRRSRSPHWRPHRAPSVGRVEYPAKAPTDKDPDTLTKHLEDVADVLRNHAEVLEQLKERELQQRDAHLKHAESLSALRAEMTGVERIVEANDVNLKNVVEVNDEKVKNDTLEGLSKLWIHLAAHSEETRATFIKAEAEVQATDARTKKLREDLEALKKFVEAAALTTSSSSGSTSPPGPTGSSGSTSSPDAASVQEMLKIRAEFDKLGQDMKERFDTVDAVVRTLGWPCLTDQCPCDRRRRPQPQGPCGPCGPGSAAGPSGAPGEGREEAPDAWAAYYLQTPKKPAGFAGGAGGGGGGGGDGGGGGGSGPSAFGIGTPHGDPARGL